MVLVSVIRSRKLKQNIIEGRLGDFDWTEEQRDAFIYPADWESIIQNSATVDHILCIYHQEGGGGRFYGKLTEEGFLVVVQLGRPEKTAEEKQVAVRWRNQMHGTTVRVYNMYLSRYLNDIFYHSMRMCSLF